MARIRTIKPETPHSESLGRVSRDARLCFILLWTQADDVGRVRGNSRMLASLLFPYDDDAPTLMDVWLDELGREGCIRRYTVEGNSYLDIPKWLEHQKIDKPSKSKFPEFVEKSRIVASPLECSSGDREGKGRDQGREVEGNGEAARECELAVEAWNLLASETGLPAVQLLTDPRKTKLRARLEECGGIIGWNIALAKIRGSPFLLGKVKNWRADFDFLLQAKSFTKLMEGGFDDNPNSPQPKSGNGFAELLTNGGV
jgi:hypothetical protein